jgi:hypothetical protein
LIKRRQFLLSSTAWTICIFVGFTGNLAMAATANTDVMSERKFWSLIDLIHGTGLENEQTDLSLLKETLSTLSAKEIKAFFETLAQKLFTLDTRAHYRSFSWFPGRSDPFLYSRLAVVAHGEDHYKSVLNNPKQFPASTKNWLEDLLYVAPEAFEIVTGQEMDRVTTVDFESFSNDKGWKK